MAGGAETITFDKTVFKTARTINLNGTQLELSDTTGTETITGPRAGVTVNAGGNSRVFQVDAGVTAAISGLTITGGSAYADSAGNYGSGGGIENDGSLTVTDSTFTNNLASGGEYAAPITGAITEGSAGGAIDSQGPSLTVTNCAFTSNEAVGPCDGDR